MNNKFIPLLFAGDINVVSVARAFHEQYGIVSSCYGKYPTGPCMDSKIIDYKANEKADQQDTFLQLVKDFAEKHNDKTVLVIGCGDSYVQLASANKNNFPENVIAPYIDVDLMNDLIHKEKFYAIYDGQCYVAGYGRKLYKRGISLLNITDCDGKVVIKRTGKALTRALEKCLCKRVC